jgi:hypothetical protein
MNNFEGEISNPELLSDALKEWSVTVRALREGRQVFLLRKGGILDSEGVFDVPNRNVLLFPTYLHEDEQREALQPCYRQWLTEESRRRPTSDMERISAWGHITGVCEVKNPNALYALSSQHIFSDSFLKYRIESAPEKPLYALFIRAYELANPVQIPMEMDYYGCKSWITLMEPVRTWEASAALSVRTYEERVRVIRARLTQSNN